MSYLVIKCGSAARGDANKNSDQDHVCLWGAMPPRFNLLKQKYPGIIFYSKSNIEKMKEAGSLFVTHLDVDGIFIEGDESLFDLIVGFRPKKKQLKKSITETAAFIKGLGWHPSSSHGYFWLVDCLYVSLRNYIYCVNGVNRIFAFGYTDAIVHFDTSIQPAMLDVREGKYIYRKGMFKENKISLDISVLENLCSRVIGDAVSIVNGGVTDWNRKWKYNYWDERLIERAIVNGEIQDNDFLSQLKNHNYNRLSLREKMIFHISKQVNPT